MKKIIWSILLVVCFATINAYPGYMEAVYREMALPDPPFDFEHAALHDQGGMCFNMPGDGFNVEYSTWAIFLNNEQYIGARFHPLVNTDALRDEIRVTALQLSNYHEDIVYVWWNMIEWVDSNGSNEIAPWEITKLRCDGLVEYCYEYRYHKVWGKNQVFERYDCVWIETVEGYFNAADHNLLPGINGNIHITPKIQRGGIDWAFTMFEAATAVDDELIEPYYYDHLISNHPNPFNPTTTISYNLTGRIANPQIDIYNIRGQHIKSIQLDGMVGENEIIWNGNDENGLPVSSGIYFYRLINDNQLIETRKMALIK
ncbi:MAG: T9SS type A sorting domain-containing protein [Clostridiales bacterium]|nr:T9SS type A sorting domain-containing protein [Clostridiales bacterium]